MILSPLAKHRFFDNSGAPLALGKLYTYAAGTVIPQATYSDQDGTTNANPVVLDAYGYANLWLDPSLSYKFVLKDANDALLWTVDEINGPPNNGGILTLNTLSTDTTVLSGYTLTWANLTISSGVTLTVNSGGCLTAFHPLTVNGTLTVNGDCYVI